MMRAKPLNSAWPQRRPYDGPPTLFEESTAATFAAAILAFASKFYGNGDSFGEAMDKAVGKVSLAPLAPWVRDAVMAQVNAFRVSDFHPADIHSHAALAFARMVRNGDVADTWINRRLWFWFGLTW